ncbi:hypothetical protein [Salinarimonas ramus]|uniref:Uncharacterized protein n=1 Tax=Salinarimonas ramus TaxID=690164 RepID=A0A917QFG9_9HYPH|nr:hypothetical protein [Salinarimonas ramus]GGK48246.1 hypothetical protein GCM10011322_38980 [Salinarimonas ramus]
MPLSSPAAATERPSATLVPFPLRPALVPSHLRSRDLQKRLMDAVFATRSLDVEAQDVATKRVAARLQILGFVAIEEVAEGGRTRRLRASEAIEAEPGLPWRLSRAEGGVFAG